MVELHTADVTPTIRPLFYEVALKPRFSLRTHRGFGSIAKNQCGGNGETYGGTGIFWVQYFIVKSHGYKNDSIPPAPPNFCTGKLLLRALY